jgi:hypothetical protein
MSLLELPAIVPDTPLVALKPVMIETGELLAVYTVGLVVADAVGTLYIFKVTVRVGTSAL